MSPFNKVEAVGIFFSIAIMAVALSVIRFKTDTFVAVNDLIEADTQGAVVVVSKGALEDEEELKNALVDASATDGTLLNLVVDDVHIGAGNEVKEGDTVTVHYVGTTQAGVRFDSSYERGEPFQFTVGAGKVIEGWEKGLLGMQVGGQRILVIPPAMAYGNAQVGPIPPNSPLVFSIELMKIN